jgi:Tfp pilus assembly protein PilF
MAAPYIPANGSDALEILPSRNDPAQKELQQLRDQLSKNRHNLGTAVRLSHRYIEIWRDGGDPRYLGYAQAALAPWWTLTEPPISVQVMRATLLQSTHQFPAALADLDAILKRDPRNAQAWLTKATVLQVIGDYPKASDSCQHLPGLAAPLVAQACLSGVTNVSGHALESYRQLSEAVRADPDMLPGIRLWVETVLAEMSVRRGDLSAAHRHFERALTAEPDNYLLAAYADFLLMQRKPDKVVAMLQPKIRIDALLLRYCIALKMMGSPGESEAEEMLTERFAAAQLRGDTIHQREQARFELEVKNNPDAALRIAQQNWQVQKEPADTLLLLQAAVAARDKPAATTVLAWINRVGLEDKALEPLVAALKAMRG